VTRTRAIFMFSAAVEANKRHSTYSSRYATIAYPWHPLFGRTLQVSPFRRGKDLKCVYTDERPDLCRELPNWMFDEGYCAGMALGAPEISIKGLNELAAVLGSFGENRAQGARSHPSKKKEKDSAEKRIPQPSAACSRSGTSKSRAPWKVNPKGLVEALADLLLEALGVESLMTKGGEDEHQDHA
jgi:hypothetical protein